MIPAPLPIREIACATLIGVLLVLWGAVVLVRRWTRSNEEERQRKLPASLRGH